MVDFARNRVFLDGRDVLLTAIEQTLLFFLARRPGSILSRRAILQHVWGDTYMGEYAKVAWVVANLRRKLGDDAHHPRYIISRASIGYMLAGPGPAATAV